MLQGFNINIHLKKIERNTHTQMGNKESKEDRCSLFFFVKSETHVRFGKETIHLPKDISWKNRLNLDHIDRLVSLISFLYQ